MLIIRIPASDASNLQQFLRERGLVFDARERRARGGAPEVYEVILRHLDSGGLAFLYLCLRQFVKLFRVKVAVQAKEVVYTIEGFPFPSIIEFFNKIAPELGLSAHPPQDTLSSPEREDNPLESGVKQSKDGTQRESKKGRDTKRPPKRESRKKKSHDSIKA